MAHRQALHGTDPELILRPRATSYPYIDSHPLDDPDTLRHVYTKLLFESLFFKHRSAADGNNFTIALCVQPAPRLIMGWWN
jgi:hypothetical protein